LLVLLSSTDQYQRQIQVRGIQRRAAMVVVVSVAVVHVEAVTSFDATRPTEAFIADLATDAFCVGYAAALRKGGTAQTQTPWSLKSSTVAGCCSAEQYRAASSYP